MATRAPALILCLLLAGPGAAGKADPGAATVTDGAGRQVRLPASPERLISMAPSVTAMLVALGLGPRLVGVSDFCRLPDGIPTPPRIGGLINPDLERIVSLDPDLAIATTSGNYLEDARRISGLGIPVYTTDTPTVEAVLSTMRELGALLGAEQQARRVTGEMQRRLDAVAARVDSREPPRVLFVVWGDPVLVPGKGAFIGDALSRAGAASVSASAPNRWTEFGLEQVVAAAPEVILTVPDNRGFAEAIRKDPRWRTVPAVREGRIHVVGNAIQQPGPEIVSGIEEVAAILHPEEAGATGRSGGGSPAP